MLLYPPMAGERFENEASPSPMDRRRFLQSLSVLGTAAVVGCTGDGGDDGITPADKFEKLRYQYIRGRVTGEGRVDHDEDEKVQSMIEDLDVRVDKLLGTLILDAADRVWPDYPLGPDNEKSDRPQHYLDVSLAQFHPLTEAYHVPGSKYEGDAEIAKAVQRGYEKLSEYFRPTDRTYGGWYDWQIGMPEVSMHTVLLMKEELPQSLLDHYLETVQAHAPAPSLNKGSGDLAKMALTWIRHGIVSEDEELLRKRGIEPLRETIEFDAENNITPDGSAIDHRIHPYNGHYQSKFIGEITKIAQLVRGTEYDLQEVHPDHIDNLYTMAHEAFEPLMWRGQPMVMVTGRFQHGGIKQKEGRRITRGFMRLGEFAPTPHAGRFRRRAKEWIQRNQTDSILEETDSLPTYALARALASDPSIEAAEPLERYKQYYNMDRAVHHETTHGTYALGLAMYSERIGNYEALNSGNGPKRGWFTSYGMTSFYTERQQHFRNGFWHTVDAERPPGTTTNPASTQALSPNTRGANSHAGGAELKGRFGTSGMVLTSPADPAYLRARKSWFCFGEAVVCLGSAISGERGDRQVATTVANRNLGAEDAGTLTVEGEETAASAPADELREGVAWAHLEQQKEAFGYVFPGGSTIRVVREANSTGPPGEWDPSPDPEAPTTGTGAPYGRNFAEEQPYTRYYAKLLIEHGTSPASADYAYAVLPDADPESTADYASDPPFEILERSEAIHAVAHPERSLTGVQAFAETTVGDTGIAVDGPASVMYREGEEELTVAIADPTQNRDAIEVQLPVGGLGPTDIPDAVRVAATDPLTLVANIGDLDDQRKGQTLTSTFAR